MALATAVVALAAIGCTRDLPQYPSHWAPIEAQSSCQALAGTYRQHGERAAQAPGGGFTSFTSLATQNDVDFGGLYVTLSFPESGVFVINALGERRFRLADGEATCHRGALGLKRRSRGPAIRGPWWNYETITLTHAADRHLIGKWELRSWGLFLAVIPVYGFWRDWYRFEPVPPSELMQPKSEPVRPPFPPNPPGGSPPLPPPEGFPSTLRGYGPQSPYK